MDLHVKYRPQNLEEVRGQATVVKSLAKLIDTERVPHAFLFTGPSGVGKTTLARILSNELGAMPADVVEVDAASNSGVDAMRKLNEPLRFMAMGGGIKVLIIDECHSLSKPAWQAMLKVTEEPPSHVYFMFCTTEVDKVPATIKTRCHSYELKDVDEDDLIDLTMHVASEEGLRLPEGAARLIAEASNGSARRALVLLSTVGSEKRLSAVRKTLETQASLAPEKQVIDLCRALIFKPNFHECLAVLKLMRDDAVQPEGVRLSVVNYAAAIVMGNRKPSERHLFQALTVMEEFQGEFNTSEKWAPILTAVARSTMGD